MHENDLHVYKLIRALTSDSERGSVQPLRRERKHTPISGAWLLNCAGSVSVYGDVPAHAAPPDKGWVPVGD